MTTLNQTTPNGTQNCLFQSNSTTSATSQNPVHRFNVKVLQTIHFSEINRKIASCSIDLGILKCEHGKFSEALACFKEALQIAQNCGAEAELKSAMAGIQIAESALNQSSVSA